MKKYEHKIIEGHNLCRPLPSGAATYGSLGWRVVGVLARTGISLERVILEREVCQTGE